MGVIMQNKREEIFEINVKRLPKKYGMSACELYDVHGNVLNCNWELHNTRFFINITISDKVLLEQDPLYLLQFIEEQIQKAIVAMGESVTGKYPFTRLWHDNHLINDPRDDTNSPLFGHPMKSVDGWVHNRFRAQQEYPRDDGSISASLDLQTVVGDFDPHPNCNSEVNPILPILTEPREIDMAQAKSRKKVVRKAPAIDPKKIKKPQCVKHEIDMEFNNVTARWECPTPDCKVVARPKRDADDKAVILGKGNVEMRLIANEAEITVILISDDNVALDVTKFVNVQDIISEFDLVNQSKVATDNGKDQFHVPIEKTIDFKNSVTLIGAEEFLKMGY